MVSQILKRSLALSSALALAFLACNTSNAGVLLTYSSSPNPIFQGGTGSIEVTLTNQGVAAQDIFSFDFTLEATPASGINFTSLNFPSSNYIYGGTGNSFDIAAGFTLQNGAGGSSISGNDAWNQFLGTGRFVNAGETVSLGTIQFSVAPNATPGNYSLTFTTVDFQQADINSPGDVLPVAGVDILRPDISIQQSVSAVPEPTSVLVFLTLAGLVAIKRRRTAKQA